MATLKRPERTLWLVKEPKASYKVPFTTTHNMPANNSQWSNHKLGFAILVILAPSMNSISNIVFVSGSSNIVAMHSIECESLRQVHSACAQYISWFLHSGFRQGLLGARKSQENFEVSNCKGCNPCTCVAVEFVELVCRAATHRVVSQGSRRDCLPTCTELR